MSYDVHIKRLEASAVFDLKGPPDKIQRLVPGRGARLPVRPNTSEGSVCWIGPDHWLLRADIESEAELLDHFASVPEGVGVVHISDTLAFFAISGPHAADILAVASPLDQSAFPDNGVTYTDVFGLKGIVFKTTEGFDIAVERSFANMTVDVLSRVSGTEVEQ